MRAFWQVLETVEEAYRANARMQDRITWMLPYQLDAVQRQALVTDMCERTFDRLGLPYVASIHLPDPKGDQRNIHVHIAFSTRPFERIGEGEWELAMEKVPVSPIRRGCCECVRWQRHT